MLIRVNSIVFRSTKTIDFISNNFFSGQNRGRVMLQRIAQNRRYFIGGSDARIIMGEDEGGFAAALARKAW